MLKKKVGIHTLLKAWPAFVIKEKFKRLKEQLKEWNKNVFGIMDLNFDKLVKDMNDANTHL